MKCLPESVLTSILRAGAVGVPNDMLDVSGDTVTDVNDELLNILAVDDTLNSPIYPPENVLDDHPKKYAKFDWPKAVFEFSVTGNSSVVIVGNTNAMMAKVTVRTLDGKLHAYGLINFSTIDNYQKLTTGEGGLLSASGFAYEYIYEPHTITVELDTQTDQNLYVGIIQAGVYLTTIFDTSQGLSQSLVDYSIEKELSNGSFYYRQRDIVRTFSGSIYMERDIEFFRFMQDVFIKYGKKPMFWYVTDLNNNNWIVYARLSGMPSGSHATHMHTVLNFSLIEVM